LGELDEEMVHESRRGDTFLLGASTWRIQEITRDRVLVTPAPGEPGKMPFWRGDGPGRPIELGMALGAFTRRLGDMDEATLRKTATDELELDAFAADNLASYLMEQRRATGCLPTDQSITVERFRDEMGDWRLCILSPFGARVHAPWALALSALLSERAGFEVQATHTDDGIMLRFGDGLPLPEVDVLLPDAAQVEELVMQAVGQSALFAGHFRENAARALLLPRRRAQGRQPLWQQRLRAKTLMAAAARYPSFPIILETYRQCLRDVFDLPALTTLLRKIERREVRVDVVETSAPSPFAQSLAFAYVAAYLYHQDAPLAERRAQALTLDRDMLRQLLGEVTLSELLDGGAIETIEAELQGTAPSHRARHADELWDLLRRVGELTLPQLRLRLQGAQGDGAEAQTLAQTWAQKLIDARRAVWVTVRQERTLAAVEDVALLRDALGVVPPAGLPTRLLGHVPGAQGALLARFARCHGPFTAATVCSRYGLSMQQTVAALTELMRAQVLTHGAMIPGGAHDEWCDVGVLRRIKRASMARLRHQVAAVEPEALAAFLPGWQGLDRKRTGSAALEEVIAQLAGLPLSFVALHEAILPARVADYSLDLLDMLCATGAIVWVGCGSLGPKDGKIMLMPRDVAQALCQPPPPYLAPTPLHAAILAKLELRGACFTTELSQVTQGLGDLQALTEALYDLMWAGQITNDTLGPLRALLAKKPTGRRGPPLRATGFGGRWSQVSLLRDPSISDTERAHLCALGLLERYGVVSREAAAAEEIRGGFSAIYNVLRAMEESGKVRRGHFVAGLSGAQFAYGGAIERLRGGRSTDSGQRPATQVLSTLDPANPYGTLLPWPDRFDAAAAHKPRRVPHAFVVLAGGALLAYVEPSAHKMLLFAPLRSTVDAAQCLVEGLAALARRAPRRTVEIRTIDGEAALGHVLAPPLTQAGMHYTFDGLALPATLEVGRA
jgi:ATP-dependent Lhr-like helicase